MKSARQRPDAGGAPQRSTVYWQWWAAVLLGEAMAVARTQGASRRYRELRDAEGIAVAFHDYFAAALRSLRA